MECGGLFIFTFKKQSGGVHQEKNWLVRDGTKFLLVLGPSYHYR